MRYWIAAVLAVYGVGAAIILWNPEVVHNYKTGSDAIAPVVWGQFAGWTVFCCCIGGAGAMVFRGK